MRNVFIFCFITLFASIAFAQEADKKPQSFDLGKGYSAHIIPAEFETITETIITSHPSSELVIIPAQYEWVKGKQTGPHVVTGSYTKLIVTPAVYENISKTSEIKSSYTTLDMRPAMLDDDGRIFRAAEISFRSVPAQTSQRTTRKIKTPEKVKEQRVVVPTRKGFSFVMTSPRMTKEMPHINKDEPFIRQALLRPARFRITNSDGKPTAELETLEEMRDFMQKHKLFPSIPTPVQSQSYKINRDLTVEIQPVAYKHVNDIVVVQGGVELKTTPAQFEWIKTQDEANFTSVTNYTEIVEIPPVFMNVTESVVIQRASREIKVRPAKFDADGSLRTPATFTTYDVPAVTKQIERRVVKTPAKLIERRVPVETRDGYSYVIVRPATVSEDIEASSPERRLMSRHVVDRPQSFTVRDNDKNIVQHFGKLEDFLEFYNALIAANLEK